MLAKPATANINPALAIPAINTPVQVRVTRAAPAPPVVANTPPALALLLILGAAALAPAQVIILTPAPVPAMQVAPAPPAAANTRLAPAPLATSGTAVAARNKFSMAPKEICIIVTVK